LKQYFIAVTTSPVKYLGRVRRSHRTTKECSHWLQYCFRIHPRNCSFPAASWIGYDAETFVGLYWCAKFGWNPCSSFDNMKVKKFCAFGLKMPTHAPKIRVSGDLTP